METSHTNPSPNGVAADAALMDLAAEDSVELMAEAALFEGESRISLKPIALNTPKFDDIVVDVCWSGISTGTERLLYTGDMPPFPGLQYPLVPGYEAVGRIVWSRNEAFPCGKYVFVPGSRGFKETAGLFGAAASRLIVPCKKAVLLDFDDPREGVVLALAATARHALRDGPPPELIIGHGVMGRLLARISMALGNPPPNVWEIDPERVDADGYAVYDPDTDGRDDYAAVYDVSGDVGIFDDLISVMKPRGELVLAGFYSDRISFAFPPAFMKEIRLRIAAEWMADDLKDVVALRRDGKIRFDDLITHEASAQDAAGAYRTAFEDSSCLKMVLHWGDVHDAAV